MDPNGFILFSVLLIAGFSPDSTADRKAFEAYAKYRGYDDVLRDIGREMVSDELKVYVGPGVFITRTLVEKRIILEWRFP
jgi:hypothetical protein